MPDGPDGKPPSLADFDYFGERRPRALLPSAAAGGGGGGGGRDDDAWFAAATQRPRGRVARLLAPLVSLAFIAVALWFAAGYRDMAAYALGPRRAARDVGDVVDLAPGSLVHNAYVTLHGVTEHRGMEQELVRGLGLHPHRQWYFRLLGSRGVFVEVDADASRYGTTTEVTVSGRVVDPARAPVYAALLRSYAETFHTTLRGGEVIVQDGVRPGERGRRYVVAAAVLAVVGLANVLVLGARWRR